jgi:RNA exonuclease 1
MNAFPDAYLYSMLLTLLLGPDFGSPPSFVRRKLPTVLSECGKTSSLIDDISIVNRYASGSSHSFPVSSGEEALLKVRKEVCFGIGCGYIYFFFDQ